MEFIRGQHNIRPRHRGCVATIGNFDGVHLGHQAILRRLAEQSKHYNLPALVITFEPHPQEFFAPHASPARLMRTREKLLALSQHQIDRVLYLKFNRHLADMEAQTFIQAILVEKLGIRFLLVGDDFRFGHGRSGDFELLRQVGQAAGFQVADTPSHTYDGQRVSSSRIRAALARGDLNLAKELLGRPYSMCGRVAHGDQRGRALGFPTANIHLHRRITPLSGVYAVTMHGIEPTPVLGVANVGRRPTVKGTRDQLEVHLFDFKKDIYGYHVQVDFLAYLRPEWRFDSLEALRQQINQDACQARAFLAKQTRIGAP
jgi:riboflavin kinase/FMN adenylyltransferase